MVELVVILTPRWASSITVNPIQSATIASAVASVVDSIELSSSSAVIRFAIVLVAAVKLAPLISLLIAVSSTRSIRATVFWKMPPDGVVSVMDSDNPFGSLVLISLTNFVVPLVVVLATSYVIAIVTSVVVLPPSVTSVLATAVIVPEADADVTSGGASDAAASAKVKCELVTCAIGVLAVVASS
jgi:hypothetical protein